MNENSKYFKLVKGPTFFGGMVNFIYSLFYLLNIKDLESWITILVFQDVIFMMIGMIVAGSNSSSTSRKRVKGTQFR